MSSVVISGDTSGTVTVTVPAVAGTNTVTIPAVTGTVMVSSNMPAFSAYASASTSLASSTFTKIQFQTKEFDTASAYDNATNYRFTPQVAGYYQVTGALQWGSNVAATTIAIYKNGSRFKTGVATNTATVSGSIVTALVYLNGSTDYVEIYGYSGTVTNTISAVVTDTYFQAAMVRTA